MRRRRWRAGCRKSRRPPRALPAFPPAPCTSRSWRSSGRWRRPCGTRRSAGAPKRRDRLLLIEPAKKPFSPRPWSRLVEKKKAGRIASGAISSQTFSSFCQTRNSPGSSLASRLTSANDRSDSMAAARPSAVLPGRARQALRVGDGLRRRRSRLRPRAAAAAVAAATSGKVAHPAARRRTASAATRESLASMTCSRCGCIVDAKRAAATATVSSRASSPRSECGCADVMVTSA